MARGAVLCHGAQAFHCSGFSSGAQALGTRASIRSLSVLMAAVERSSHVLVDGRL